jgi:hypothetical protein
MIKYLADSSIDPGSVILVTHQRYAHINKFFPGTFMHLYGHLHGFKHSIFKGTHCNFARGVRHIGEAAGDD